MTCTKTFLIQFLHKDGNGWAIVNADNVRQACTIFKYKSNLSPTKVVTVKEIKCIDSPLQIVFEGSVCTSPRSFIGPPGPPGPPAPELTQEDFDEICV